MPKIEFVSYNGKFPNLCSGILTILIDGEERRLENCLCSGGRVYFTPGWEEHVEKGNWIVSEAYLPEDLMPYKEDIEEVVNENVPKGCCGGCV